MERKERRGWVVRGGQKVWVRDARGELVQVASSVACFPSICTAEVQLGLFFFLFFSFFLIDIFDFVPV